MFRKKEILSSKQLFKKKKKVLDLILIVSQSESYASHKPTMGLEYTDRLKPGYQDHPGVGDGMGSRRTI